jgi:hypothetical protein
MVYRLWSMVGNLTYTGYLFRSKYVYHDPTRY